MVLLASDFDTSKYLRATDLKEAKKFRINKVTEGKFEGERKAILWFTNDERGFSLNQTNLRTLAGAFGDEMEKWKDKIIVLFPTMVDFKGKMVPGLRVRIPPPKEAQAGNGAAQTKPAAAPAQKPDPVDPELADEPKKPSGDELNDPPW